MKRGLLSIILVVLTIADMALIFYFSSRTSEQSVEDSLSIAGAIMSSMNDGEEVPTVQPGPRKYNRKLDIIDTRLRHFSHMAEYIPMGLCIALLCMGNLKVRLKKTLSVLIALAISVLYAISDEVHQLYVPGRSFELVDIWRDFAGACIGVAIAMLIWFAVKKILIQKQHEQN